MRKKVIIIGLIALMLTIGSSVFAQTLVTLDQAISYGVIEIESRLAQGTKVMALNFISPSQRLSNYVLDEMTTILARNGKLSVVDKSNLEFILQELHYQRSANINDESSRSIGRILGAQYVISGIIEEFNSNYIIQFRTMAIEPEALQTLLRVGVRKDTQITDLIGASTFNVTTGDSPSIRIIDTSGMADVDASGLAEAEPSIFSNNVVLSAGAGLYGGMQLMHLISKGASASYDPSFLFGTPIFLTAELFKYLLLDLSAYYRHGDYYGAESVNAIGATFSVLGQYPIQLTDRFTLFPFLGVGYEKYFFAKPKGQPALTFKNLSEADSIFAKPGVGLNMDLVGNFRLTARLVYDFLLYNKMVNPWGGDYTILQHSPSLFIGASYVFFKM